MSERDQMAGPWNLLNDLIVDHPMWIGDDGQPLDYSPEREARIHDFIAEASEALARLLVDQCPHADVCTFRSYPPRSECRDCGAVVELKWCVPATTDLGDE